MSRLQTKIAGWTSLMAMMGIMFQVFEASWPEGYWWIILRVLVLTIIAPLVHRSVQAIFNEWEDKNG